jgi:hypothetical protein
MVRAFPFAAEQRSLRVVWLLKKVDILIMLLSGEARKVLFMGNLQIQHHCKDD